MKRRNFLYNSLLISISFLIKSCSGKTGDKPSVGFTKKLPASLSSRNIFITKGEEGYDHYRKCFNKRIDHYPAVIAVCSTASEVAEAVKYAITNKLAVSVKSGGHSFEGYSVNNSGLLIDCSNMNAIIDNNDSTYTIGPGCQIKELYENLLPDNKIIPAGSCGGVGIGGLTLGGGYGIFSRMHGLTCDKLIHVTAVNGKGEIINSDKDPELLWACRGGGNGHFAVITDLKFQSEKIMPVINLVRYTSRKVTIPRAIQILKIWFSTTENLSPQFFSAFVFNGRSIYILITDMECDESKCLKLITPLDKVMDHRSMLKDVPCLSAVKQFYGMKSPVFFKNSSAGMYNTYTDIEEFIPLLFQSIMNKKGLIFQVNTVGGNINDPKASSASCYPHRDKKWLSELQCYWKNPSETAEYLRRFKETKSLLTNQQHQYANYPDIDDQEWQTTYYGNNYEKLRKIKARLDPYNVIRHPQSIV